jgi:hypothetical protein
MGIKISVTLNQKVFEVAILKRDKFAIFKKNSYQLCQLFGTFFIYKVSTMWPLGYASYNTAPKKRRLHNIQTRHTNFWRKLSSLSFESEYGL